MPSGRAVGVKGIHSGFAQKTSPLGSMVALPSSDPNIKNEACWTKANVRGVLLRVFWSQLEPSDGGYNLSYFATGIELAPTHNKKLVLSVDGYEAPKWLYNKGVPQRTSKNRPFLPYPPTKTPHPKR